MLGALIHASHVLSHLTHITNVQGGYHDPHFIGEETVTQCIEVNYAKSHSH